MSTNSVGTRLSMEITIWLPQLTIRQDIGGIKQRIAAIKIPEAEVDIPIFEWAIESCEVLDSSSVTLPATRSQLDSPLLT